MRKQEGFTLIELMIGITVGLIIIVGASSFYLSILYANTNGVKQQKLEQTAQALVSTMVADIRRAGYTSPGQATPSLTIDGKNEGYIYAKGDCLLLTYRKANDSIAYRGYLRDAATNEIYVLMNESDPPSSCDRSDPWWNPKPVTDNTQLRVEAPTTAPSPSGTESGVVFQADANFPPLKWINFRLTSTNLKTKVANSTEDVTRDVVAAVTVRN